ncbi:MAG: sirohydrochlorin cobaltochelatase [Bacteroidales bacterium]|nr:sirohydrochlorin cobaltochelatase [Bacteroidales bacterium]MBQ1753381.1 sirohydrochlorin cobaltochelatase [Bacteroidales bacterium]MBQ2195302.1 sirohydrochlorin cobaltochelatase [Bacteroidales bacterium]MBQ5438578.1 sirohydrochlorin cobaltochelatase [Bacteroidales bacterium]MBQ5482469.1 sirohydrochlorin cobaltochelatase [Bacteroidales bacterium]
MKTTKLLTFVLLAGLVFGFSACEPRENNEYNYNAYQKAVNETVKKNKKNNKAILLVAFGSTWQQAFDAFDATVDAYKSAFSGYDVYLSFSSAICINRAAAGENAADGAEVRNYYAPPFWLTAFAQKGVMYNEIVVQSLQVIPGEEYTRVINYIKDFANNANGDLDDDYLSRVVLKLGVPLLQDEDKDVTAVAKELNNLYKSQASKDIVAFMGHGNPDSYDTYKANIRYTQLEEALQELNPHYFVGTVDMMENFKTHVYERMADAGLNKSNLKVYLHPLMSIDGDHGHNDMAGDDLPEKFEGKTYTFADLLAEANDEGEVEDCSWKVFFGANGSGLTCNNSTMIEKGLLELPSIRQIWMNHTRDAINGEPLDYYHSKNPE